MMSRARSFSSLLVISGALGASAINGCTSKAADGESPSPQPSTQPTTMTCPDAGAAGGSAPMTVVPPSVEWVAFHTEVPLDPNAFHAMGSSLVGPSAQAGSFLAETEVTPGVFVKSEAEPSTPDQARVTVSFDDGGANPRRVLAVAPASFQVGSVFLATVDAAIAKMQADNANAPGQGEKFLLEYRVLSSQGGRLSFGVQGDRGVYSLVIDVSSPKTSLLKDTLGKAAGTDGPYDSVAGTVWFHMTKDDFDFFVGHAYGAGATSRQNFTDFALVPFEWLRLTVDPHLDQRFVNVGFELLGTDGTRTKIAKAPASIMAGGVFQAMVDRNMTTMIKQEKAKTGSSTPWQVPFYYDNPDGGGVVQVIAQGAAGLFSVAYAVESPHNPLKDVPFVEYVPVDIPPPDPSLTASCDMLGDPTIMPAAKGTLDITFSAADTVKNSPDLKGPLVGTLYCAVFHASDVTVAGPSKTAVSLQDFQVPNADLTTMPTFTTDAFFAGDYQILCAQDLDKDGGASKGDPVTLPIGSFKIECNKNPVHVEFAILDPG